MFLMTVNVNKIKILRICVEIEHFRLSAQPLKKKEKKRKRKRHQIKWIMTVFSSV